MPGQDGTEVSALLFSDIEGSTKLLQRLGPGYVPLLARHQALVRSVIAAHGGVERGTEGDSFFVTFSTVGAAVRAAVDAQRALAVEPWPAHGTVRVRIGIHVGEIAHTEAGIVGLAVHHAARIASAAHGGEVLVSGEVRAGAGELPGLRWVGLGEHELRDVGSIELFRLSASGLQEQFPPPRTEQHRSNLPVASSSLVGRVEETADVVALLVGHRLVTLTGAGGCGKTRLALNVAAHVHGVQVVSFVDLAEVRDPSDVVRAVGDSLGVDPSLATISRVLQRQPTLVVLDNCEHVLEDVAELVDRVLSQAPASRVLATSREPLGLTGEVVHRVPSLTVPGEDASLAQILEADAVRLFEERARQVRAGYRVTSADAEAVRSICARLDGIPLAIELAAARVSTMSPAELERRLADRFRLLTGKQRTPIGRQRTLLATVSWSYRLLTPLEQRVLARLSVLRPGFALDDAVAVVGAGEPEYDLVDAVTALHDKSLLDTVSGEANPTRFRLSETILQFAADRLADRDEEEAIRDRHAAHFRAVADRAVLGPQGSAAATWIEQWRGAKANIRAAMEWLSMRAPRTAMALLCDWVQVEEHVDGASTYDPLPGVVDTLANHPDLEGTAESAWAAAQLHLRADDEENLLAWARTAEARLTPDTDPVLATFVRMLHDSVETTIGEWESSVDRRTQICAEADRCPGPFLGLTARLYAFSRLVPPPYADAIALAERHGLGELALSIEAEQLWWDFRTGLTPEQVRRARQLAAALAGSSFGPTSHLDLILADHGHPQEALALSLANLHWLRTHYTADAGFGRHLALAYAAHAHVLAGAPDTAADLADMVLAVYPPDTGSGHPGFAVAMATRSALHRRNQRPDLAARLLARVPADRLTGRYRGEVRMLDEAALVATSFGRHDAAHRLLVTADCDVARAGTTRSPWQRRQIAPLAAGIDPATAPLTTEELRSTMAALAGSGSGRLD